MDSNSISGIIRAIVPAILAYAVGKGYITESVAVDITAAAVAVGAAIWSIVSNRKPAA